MNDVRPGYFQSTLPVETFIRRIKGNARRAMILMALEEDGIDSIPEPWLVHDLSAGFKNILGAQQPDHRGGEDLPDLLDGEIEVARVSLVDSIHGEVTSLRARLEEDGKSIQLRIVGEYEEQTFELEQDTFAEPLTAEEALKVFRNSEPCASSSSCEQRFSSDFYPDLDSLADTLDIKQVWID
jgi:hypothetical protein